MREHAIKINERELAGELQRFISIKPSWSEDQGNKISVSENIRDVFEYVSDVSWDGRFPEKIGKKSVKNQVKKIKPIYNYVLNELSAYNKEDLQGFLKAVSLSYAIVIKIDDNRDVFAIFERTNARGLDLNIGDLLKNYIFSYGIDDCEEKWSEVIDNSEGSLQRMLKYFWISRKGYISQSKLYHSLRDYGKELGIVDFVNELNSFSLYYKMVQSADVNDTKNWLEDMGFIDISKNEDHYNRINRVFQSLRLFRVTQAYPLIYSIFVSYRRDGGGNYRRLFKILESLENYHFVNNVISGRIGNEVEKFYAEYSTKFFIGRKQNIEALVDFKFIEGTDDFLKSLSAKKAFKEEFISNFIDSIVYVKNNPKSISLINYVFDRINNFNTKGAQRVDIYSPEKDLKKRNYNIDHFLPQNEKKKYDKEEDLEMFDKIGNLLVISSHSNSEFQDKSPIEKIKMIEEDPKHFGNLRYIGDFMKDYKDEFIDWDFNSIEKRSKEVAADGFDRIWQF